GTYDGTQAAALGGFYRPNKNVLLSLGASHSFGGNNKTAANVGVTFGIGQGGEDVTTVDSSTVDSILQRLEALDKEVAGLKAENKKLAEENAQQKQELEALKK
uniref:YadA-like family protein n=1 Tax=uncultured Megasphaera sp. TaxID=165188 RepID=UPI002658D483